MNLSLGPRALRNFNYTQNTRITRAPINNAKCQGPKPMVMVTKAPAAKQLTIRFKPRAQVASKRQVNGGFGRGLGLVSPETRGRDRRSLAHSKCATRPAVFC